MTDDVITLDVTWENKVMATYTIVKVIKLFKKLPQRILGANYNYNLRV